MQYTTKQKLMMGGILLLLTNLAVAAPKFTPGSQPTGWVSKPEVSYYNLATGREEKYYQLDFRKDTWSGNVLAYYINSTARIQTRGPWDIDDPTLTTAASRLENTNYDTGRKIATLGGPFRWGSLSGAEQTALGSVDILNFIRGDRSNEEPNGKSYFPRESVLGDIIHSNISYVDDGTNQTLYVGSNDGMLHAFNANTGEENWAYIPSMLIPKLSLLKDKHRIHTHFVDGPISIANLADNEKTILVSGLGAGGAGLFALDITTATAASELAVKNKVLWEITATGAFANLGYTYGTPLITRLNDGTAVVIIGNGYVNAGSGTAVLYIINAMTGALISAIDTGSGNPASPNGLSSPTLFSTDGDARPEYVYAGDIDGNLWKFDLSTNKASHVFKTSDGRAITTAPAVQPHHYGGQMIVFATGRILISGDKSDTGDHHVYGIWDGAPDRNTSIVEQFLSSSDYNDTPVRTITNNSLNWEKSGNKGWKVTLPPGERVVGEKPFYNNGRFYFVSTNPTIDPTENWLHELVFNTGGSPLFPIFDLNHDTLFNDLDLAANKGIPIAKYLGAGAFSQPLFVDADSLSTTLYAFHQDLQFEEDIDEPTDPGVSGGHFDFDIYYFEGSGESIEPTGTPVTKTLCIDKNIAQEEYYDLSPTVCQANFDAGYGFLLEYSVSTQACAGKIKYIDATCSTYTSTRGDPGAYANEKHVHEYDDKYDVTGVNMLNASLTDFNLPNAIKNPTVLFKVLVMNQYLNPAAMVSVGTGLRDYISIKTYGNLASETDPAKVLSGLTAYSRQTVGTLIYNLPVDAFKSKDWWGDGTIRAGLIPTKTGCVNSVNADGTMKNVGVNGLTGLNGERFDGALTIQIIRSDTPSTALELNHSGTGGLTESERVKYGWRVKQEEFSNYVLAEYTSFWHHPNGKCYGDDDWIPDPPEDFDSAARSIARADGSSDPTDGVFGAGLAVVSVVTTTVGSVTTTVTTYSDGTEYIKTETENDDGKVTITQKFRDTEEIITTVKYVGDGGHSGFVDPNSGSPEEELSSLTEGRQSWRDIID